VHTTLKQQHTNVDPFSSCGSQSGTRGSAFENPP
jgi:hypothetical protein